MATISKYQTASGATLYRVRYRTPDHRQTDKRGFTTKRDAQAFANSVEVSKLRGEYVAPADARVTVGEIGPGWLDRQRGHLKPSAYSALEIAWRLRVAPRWGARALGDIRPSAVQQWMSDLRHGDDGAKPLGASVVARAHQVLSAILADAVRDRMIAANPATGIKLPRKTRKRPVYLTHRQVADLAAASGDLRGAWCCCWPTPACAGVRRSGCGCATWTCCGGGPPCRRTPFRSGRRYTWAPPRRTSSAACRCRSSCCPIWPASARARTATICCSRGEDGGHLQRPHTKSGWFDKAVAASGVPRVTRARPAAHRGQPGGVGGCQRQGGPADARARQRGHDAGHLRRPVR